MENIEQNGNLAPENKENKPEKLFSQAELDEVVKSRLAKEREKYRDYDNLKQTSAQYEALRIEHDETKSKLSALKEYEDNYKNVFDELVGQLNDTQKSLIPQEYSLVKKVDFIKKLKEATAGQTENKPSPLNVQVNLPTKSEKKPAQNGTMTYGDGKYSSLREFAESDPTGYREWAKRNPYRNN